MSVKAIYKTDDIIKVGLEDTLSKALSKLHSSHDSAFVIDEENNLKGIVNPYYCVIKKSYPSNAKAKHCMFIPPKIQINTSIGKAAKMMIESKVHYLPVYENDIFTGILSARRLLDYIKRNHTFDIKLSEYIKRKKPLVTVFEDEFVSRAVHLFKQFRISKLVVVSRDYKLKGIVTHFDIVSYLSSPKDKKSINLKGDKAPYMKKPLRNFMKSNVIKLKESSSIIKAVELILDKEIGSVVVIDDKDRPIGIITTKDILLTLVEKKKEPKFELVKQQLSSASEHLVRILSKRFIKKSERIGAVDKIKLTVKEEKSGNLYKAVVSFFSSENKVIHRISEEGYNLRKVLMNILKKSTPRK